jgi:hypothetical protein
MSWKFPNFSASFLHSGSSSERNKWSNIADVSEFCSIFMKGLTAVFHGD